MDVCQTHGANVTMSTLAILGGALAVLFLSPWFEAPVLILPLLLLLPEQILVRDLRRKERADLRQPLPDDPELMETETQIFQATVLSQDALVRQTTWTSRGRYQTLFRAGPRGG